MSKNATSKGRTSRQGAEAGGPICAPEVAWPCSGHQPEGVTEKRKVLFGLGKEGPLLVSYLVLGCPRRCPHPPPHHPGPWRVRLAVSDWAGTASLGPRGPPRLFLVMCPLSRTPLGVPAPLSHPQGAALLQNAARTCQGMQAVPGAWPPSGLGTCGPVLACGGHVGREPWPRFVPLSIVTGKSILKLRDLSLLHVLAGSSQSPCLDRSCCPRGLPVPRPSAFCPAWRGSAAGGRRVWCRAGHESPPRAHPPLPPHHSELPARGGGGVHPLCSLNPTACGRN